jgi:hypothetical protein
MYQDHPLFLRPAPEARIWRYVDLERLVSLLHTRTLHFARADQMSDPFEGVYPPINSTLEYLSQALPDIAFERHSERWPDMVREIARTNRLITFLSCWYVNSHESEAMWRLYASKGIAIRSTCERLCQSLNDPDGRNVFVGMADYIDYEIDWISMANSFSAVLAKRKSFEHERELRAVIDLPLKVNSDQTQDEIAQPNGLSENVDVQRLIEHIFVYPGSSPWITEVVRQVVDRFGFPDIPVTRSPLLDPWGV